MKCVVVLLLLLQVCLIFETGDAWSGNYESSSGSCYLSRRLCGYRWFGSCCAWKTVREGYTCTKYRCQNGWTHNGTQVCTIPVCWPPCENGGSCISPGVCNCTEEFAGYRCELASCSHLAPCYPGTCQNADRCDCSRGFTTLPANDKQNYCLKIEDNRNTQLDMYQMQVRLSFWPRYKNPPMELHSIMADSTDRPGDQKDSFWTNRRDFNRLETTCSSQYFSPDLTGKPRYIGSSTLGIVNGSINVYLEKRGFGVGPPVRSLNKTISCERNVSDLNPETSIFSCSVVDRNFDHVFEHGDAVMIVYNATVGGFREVVNRNNGNRFNQTFTRVTRAKAVEFKFDFIPPSHCIENTSPCTDPAAMKSMLNVPDMTRVGQTRKQTDRQKDRRTIRRTDGTTANGHTDARIMHACKNARIHTYRKKHVNTHN